VMIFKRPMRKLHHITGSALQLQSIWRQKIGLNIPKLTQLVTFLRPKLICFEIGRRPQAFCGVKVRTC